MSSNLRNSAEALAVRLEIGAAGVADAVAWADSVMAAESHPHWSVCEVATMGKSYEPDVARALREVPGEFDEKWLCQEVIQQLARGLAEDRTRADKIASALYELAWADELPEGELLSIAWWAWDALAMADDGTVEMTRDQVVDQMLEALWAAAREEGA